MPGGHQSGLYCFLHYPLETVSLINLELMAFTRPTTQRTPGIYLPPSRPPPVLGLQHAWSCLFFITQVMGIQTEVLVIVQ